jgi:hypothetical protein
MIIIYINIIKTMENNRTKQLRTIFKIDDDIDDSIIIVDDVINTDIMMALFLENINNENYLIDTFELYKSSSDFEIRYIYDELIIHSIKNSLIEKKSLIPFYEYLGLGDDFTINWIHDNIEINNYLGTYKNTFLDDLDEKKDETSYIKLTNTIRKIVNNILSKISNDRLINIFNSNSFIDFLGLSIFDINTSKSNVFKHSKDYAESILKRMNTHKNTKEKLINRFIEITNMFENNYKWLNNNTIKTEFLSNVSCALYFIISQVISTYITDTNDIKDIENYRSPINMFDKLKNDKEKSDDDISESSKCYQMFIAGFITVYITIGQYRNKLSNVTQILGISPDEIYNIIKQSTINIQYCVQLMASKEFHKFFIIEMDRIFVSKLENEENNNSLLSDDIKHELLILLENIPSLYEIKDLCNKLLFNIYERKYISNIHTETKACEIIHFFLEESVKNKKDKVIDFTDEEIIRKTINGTINVYNNFTEKLKGEGNVYRHKCLDILNSMYLINKSSINYVEIMDEIFKEDKIAQNKFILNIFLHIMEMSELLADIQKRPETTSNIKTKLNNVIIFFNSLVLQVYLLINSNTPSINKIICKDELKNSIINSILHTLNEYAIVREGKINHLNSISDVRYIRKYYDTIKQLILILMELGKLTEIKKILTESEIFSSKFFSIIYKTLSNYGKLTDKENIMIGEFISDLSYNKDKFNKDKDEDYIEPDEIPEEFLDPLTYVPIINPLALPKSNENEYFIFEEKVIKRQLLSNNINPFTREETTIEKLYEINNRDEVKTLLDDFKLRFKKWKIEYLSKKNN